jgi:hypothetical protein
LTPKIASIIVSGSGWVLLWRPQSAAADGRSSRARWPFGRAGKLEVVMAGKPKAKKAATSIARTNPNLIWRHCLATDPAVGTLDGGPSEFFTQLDKPTQNKVMAARLEAEANVHKTLADAHSQVAGILKSGG